MGKRIWCIAMIIISAACDMDYSLIETVKPYKVELENQYELKRVGCYYNDRTYYSDWNNSSSIKFSATSGQLLLRMDNTYLFKYGFTLTKYHGDSILEDLYTETFKEEGVYSYNSRFIEGSFLNPTGHSGQMFFTPDNSDKEEWQVSYRTSFQRSELPMTLTMQLLLKRDDTIVKYLEWTEL